MTPDLTVDAKNLSSMVAAMQTQIWILIFVLGILVPLLGVLIRMEWLSMRETLKRHGEDIQKQRERWANYDGAGSVAAAVIEGTDKIAEAIDRKYSKR